MPNLPARDELVSLNRFSSWGLWNWYNFWRLLKDGYGVNAAFHFWPVFTRKKILWKLRLWWSKIFHQRVFFWLNMKNFEISVLTANSRYLQAATLKIIWHFFSKHLQSYLKYSPSWSKFPSVTKHNLVSVHLKFWASSHDVMAAMLMFQNNETEAMLVYKGNPMGVEFISYVNIFFCSNKLA